MAAWIAAIPLVSKVLDKLWPDAEDKAKLEDAKLRLLEMSQTGELELLSKQTDIIKAEAQGDSVLQRSWRPLTMLTFVALVVAHWLGFTAENLTEDVVLKLLSIVQVGIGGYVVGRSAEKAVKEWKRSD